MINKHYGELTTEAEAKASFAIMPHVPVVEKLRAGSIPANENGRRQLLMAAKRDPNTHRSDALPEREMPLLFEDGIV